MLARMPMTATTIIISISVNPADHFGTFLHSTKRIGCSPV